MYCRQRLLLKYLMYNITETDIEFQKILPEQLVELEKKFAQNLNIQESTLEIIYNGIKHSQNNNLKSSRIIWNAAGYVNIVSYDLKVIGRNLMISNREWDKRYFARQAALLIYEASEDLFKILGKDFRIILNNLSQPTQILPKLKEITTALNTFNENYKSKMHKIRNVSIAHRDKDIIDQIDLIHSISWVDAITFLSAFDEILNKTGVFLQQVIDKSIDELNEFNT